MGSRRESIEDELSSFILEDLLEDSAGVGADPLAADAVDSLGLEQLAEHIERTYGFSVEDEEMVRDNFGNIAALAAFVEAKAVART